MLLRHEGTQVVGVLIHVFSIEPLSRREYFVKCNIISRQTLQRIYRPALRTNVHVQGLTWHSERADLATQPVLVI